MGRPLVLLAALLFGVLAVWVIHHRALRMGFTEPNVTIAALVLGLLWAIFWMYRVLDDVDGR